MTGCVRQLGAVADPGTLDDRSLDGPLDAFARCGADERADRGSVVRRSDTQLLHLGAEASDELVGDVGVHVEAVGRGAGLAAVAELRDHRPVNRGLEVGAGCDDERRVAAELHGSVDHPVGRLAEQQPTRRRSSR